MVEVGSDDEILEFAIAREIEANRFYLSLAERVADPEMRRIFEDLAGEELEHKEKLELEFIKTGKVLPSSDSPSELDMDYKDLLLLGMEKEEASFRTYVGLVGQSQDEQSREVLLALAEEEVKHKLRFETEYDMLLRKI